MLELEEKIAPHIKAQINSVTRAVKFLFNDKGLWKTRHLLLPWLPLPRRLPDGNWMLCYPDVMGQIIFKKSPFEEDERTFVSGFLQPGMVFFDIGAHHGLYSLLGSKRVGLQGRVYTFEPVPSVYRKLLLNLRLNHCRNVVAEKLALGCYNGEVDMHVVLGRETGCNSLRLPGSDVATSTSIIRATISTIDDYVEKMKINAIDIIKIDAEGGELDVLRGAECVLTGNSRPFVLCEVEDRRTASWGYSANEIIDWLALRGYKWFEPSKNGLIPYQRCENYNYDGLVAAPLERLLEIESLLINVRSE